MASTVADRAIGAIIGAAVADAAGKINCETDVGTELFTATGLNMLQTSQICLLLLQYPNNS